MSDKLPLATIRPHVSDMTGNYGSGNCLLRFHSPMYYRKSRPFGVSQALSRRKIAPKSRQKPFEGAINLWKCFPLRE